tara:strand:- start:68 stop:373 length:306 start_codon:yes stop_codon:yes gene_type:complete
MKNRLFILISKLNREPNIILNEIISKIESNKNACDTLKRIAGLIITRNMTKTFSVTKDKEYLFNLCFSDLDERDIGKFKMYLIQECISYYKFNSIGFFEIE